MSGMLLNDKQVYVGPLLRKQERDTSQGIVVMTDADGKSKCFGFANFENPDDAAKAVEALNGKKFDEKEWNCSLLLVPSHHASLHRLCDTLVESIEDLVLLHSQFLRRLIELQQASVRCPCSEESGLPGKVAEAQFSQMRPVVMPPAMAPCLSTPPGGPRLGQQLFYGQGPPGVIPPQPGFGYQQQLVPGMRPGAAHMTNFLAHMMLPRGRVYRYPGGGGMPDMSLPGVGGMMAMPYDMGGMPMRDPAVLQQVPITALASALANATPDHQRTMLGENLYPLVEQLEPDAAAKVTGVLLEMDQPEILHLLESPEALKAKVAEAMEVLRSVAVTGRQRRGSARILVSQ
ncbi:hypothetical protein MLD38_026978 [Melastoma candidum]|uniref:Uncharacterized protein n=1 Tax=Melastoma candidum TaxID=119954 RepID=A0ACB9P095_9MYRT|nr:hypothetical protein MLD38_026978 [Melastoma candidum]